MTKTLSVNFYQTILKKIKQEIVRAKRTMEESYHREILITHWNIGKILEDPFIGQWGHSPERARLVEQLAKDLNRSESFFYDLCKFYRFYPTLPKTPLTWTHYLNLIRIEDKREREEFENKAIKESLSSQKLFQLIFFEKSEKGKADETGSQEILAKPGTLPCVRGKLYRYRCLFRKDIPLPQGHALVDMGFGFLRSMNIPDWKSNGSPVPIRSYKVKGKYSVRRATKHPEYLYTYQATVSRVVDADTLWLNIDLGFDSWIEQKLRLRGIDAPEVSSALGIAAKDHVKKIFAQVSFVICKTYKEDKYGRYLADIFYSLTEKDPEVVAQAGTYLNQELLDQGHAVLYG